MMAAPASAQGYGDYQSGPSDNQDMWSLDNYFDPETGDYLDGGDAYDDSPTRPTSPEQSRSVPQDQATPAPDRYPPAASRSGPSSMPPSAAVNGYKLGAGDILRIQVFGHDDLAGKFEVDEAGYIAFPLIGEVLANGLTARQLETVIEDRLSPDYLKSPKASVEVTNYRPFYILGEVNAPGSYAYVANMRVINAIALAGGFTYRAAETRVQVKRAATGKTVPVTEDSVILPGDIITVPERFF